jgi:hypothetical protein
MSFHRRTAALLTAAALGGAPGSLFAQDAAAGPSDAPATKSIGVPSAQEAKVEPALIAMNAAGAILAENKLTLTGVAPNAIIFADRPTRAAGHALTAQLLEEWGSTPDASFAKDPPNATVSAFSKDGSLTRDAVVVLKNPSLQADKLKFDVQVLEGSLKDADGPASVFIDIIGLPFAPLSFAGVARRTAYRSAMYNAATHPYGYSAPCYPAAYYPPPRCGYYPLPPCYRAYGTPQPFLIMIGWMDQRIARFSAASASPDPWASCYGSGAT